MVRWVKRWRNVGKLDGHPIFQIVEIPLLIFTVKNEDGSFRPLDGRVLRRVVDSDFWRLNRYTDWRRELDAIACGMDAQNDKMVDYRITETFSGPLAEDAARVKKEEWFR